MSEKDFKFHVPVELYKADPTADDEDPASWKIRGIASTPDEDLQGETIDQNGLDISVLKAGRGLLNFDHQKGPENIVGQIEDADFVEHEGKRALMVEGYLFKHQPRAQAFHNILKSLKKGASSRVHMSVEGKILQRDFQDSKQIKKARIDKVALTMDPVNPYTYAELIKCLCNPEAEQPIETKEETVEITKSDLESLVEVAKKALAAGVGHSMSPSQRSDGAAMARESLDSAPKSVTYREKARKHRKRVLKSVIERVRKAHPNEDPIALAEWVLESFLEKVYSTKGE